MIKVCLLKKHKDFLARGLAHHAAPTLVSDSDVTSLPFIRLTDLHLFKVICSPKEKEFIYPNIGHDLLSLMALTPH